MTDPLTNYGLRIKKAIKLLRAERLPAALLVSSAPLRNLSRDQSFPYRQDSDFLYFTGSELKGALLCIAPALKKPLLIAPKVDEHALLWEGAPPDPKKIARAIGAKLIISNTPYPELKPYLKEIEILYFQNTHSSLSAAIAERIIANTASSAALPKRFAHADLIMEQLRLYKSTAEVRAIKAAAKVTNEALFAMLPYLKAGVKEFELAAHLEHSFKLSGCTSAFNTIVATGASAATLHYEKLNRSLKRNDLLLIDLGASYSGYAADISRTLPVSCAFLPWQQDLYQIVLDAQDAAIKRVKSGVKIASVYDAAAKVITQGLRDMRVLKGSPSSLLKQGAYKKYFPHRIGHSLGLDVHDVGALRGGGHCVLEAGMVLTIEPGLYFAKALKGIKPCGIRIEDDLLVKKNGSEILSAGFPKTVSELEDLLS